MATNARYPLTAEEAVSSGTTAAQAAQIEVENWDEEIRNTFRRLRSSIFPGDGLKTIALTSCFPSEGVTALARGVVKSALEAGQAMVYIGRPERRDEATTAADVRAQIREAREKRVAVVVDAGSLRRDGWVLELGDLLDGVVLVVESGRCRPGDVADGATVLRRSNLPVVGCVVNRTRRVLPAILED